MTSGLARFAFLFAFLGSPLAAETLPIETIYPAENDQLAALRTISFSRFSGGDGEAFGIALEQVLREATIRRAPYYTILGGQGPGKVDGLVSGSASSGIETRFELGRERFCARQDNKGRCQEWRWIEVRCNRRNVTLNYTVTVEGRRRERLFTTSKAVSASDLICPASVNVPPFEVVVSNLVRAVAQDLRGQFAPIQKYEALRVKEGVEGLEGNARKQFKEAIKATKRSVPSACSIWQEVDQLVPDHPPTLFNLGLCAESRQEFDTAEDYFNKTLYHNRGEAYATEGLVRIDKRRRAERQIASRAR